MLSFLTENRNRSYPHHVSLSERTEVAVDQILRLRRAESLAPDVEEITSVREDLERQLGPTLSRGMAARLTGVSQTAFDRWARNGEIPTVLTPRGRIAIPTGLVLDLVEEVRSRDTDARHPLAGVIRDRHQRTIDVEHLVRRELAPLLRRLPEGHRVPELRSLALHTVVAHRLDARVVRRARRRLQTLEREGLIDPVYAERWNLLLASPLPQLKRALVEDTQQARDLRQNTPFAGVLSEPERRQVLSLVG